MINFKKPVFLFSLAVLTAQVVWAAPATKPPVTTGMTVLLDASDIDGNGIIDASPKGIADLNGGIETWYNKSALNGGKAVSANNFFAIDVSKKPKWSGYTLNGKTVISFKSGGFKTSSLTQIPANSNYTKFVVFMVNANHTSNNLISSGSTALWTGQAAGTTEKKGVLKAYHDPENYLSDKSNKLVEAKDFHIATTRYAKGLPATTPALPNVLRMDAEKLASNSLAKPHAASVILIGAGNEQNKFLLEGEIAEAIVYNRALSDGDIIKVEKYLKAKWGGFKPNKITSFTLGTPKKEVGKTINLFAKVSTKLPIIFSSLSESICKVVDNKSVELLAIGKCILTAGQVGDETYRSAETLVKEFQVEAQTTPTTPTTATESSGGGGSTSPMWLMLFGFISLLRRKVSLR